MPNLATIPNEILNIIVNHLVLDSPEVMSAVQCSLISLSSQRASIPVENIMPLFLVNKRLCETMKYLLYSNVTVPAFSGNNLKYMCRVDFENGSIKYFMDLPSINVNVAKYIRHLDIRTVSRNSAYNYDTSPPAECLVPEWFPELSTVSIVLGNHTHSEKTINALRYFFEKKSNIRIGYVAHSLGNKQIEKELEDLNILSRIDTITSLESVLDREKIEIIKSMPQLSSFYSSGVLSYFNPERTPEVFDTLRDMKNLTDFEIGFSLGDPMISTWWLPENLKVLSIPLDYLNAKFQSVNNAKTISKLIIKINSSTSPDTSNINQSLPFTNLKYLEIEGQLTDLVDIPEFREMLTLLIKSNRNLRTLKLGYANFENLIELIAFSESITKVTFENCNSSSIKFYPISSIDKLVRVFPRIETLELPFGAFHLSNLIKILPSWPKTLKKIHSNINVDYQRIQKKSWTPILQFDCDSSDNSRLKKNAIPLKILSYTIPYEHLHQNKTAFVPLKFTIDLEKLRDMLR